MTYNTTSVITVTLGECEHHHATKSCDDTAISMAEHEGVGSDTGN